jgi:hypothetical protein
MIDLQNVIDWLFVGFSAAVGLILRVFWAGVVRLKDDLKELEHNLSVNYVRKDDFYLVMGQLKDEMKEMRIVTKDGFARIDAAFALIFEKVDSKADKQ